MLRRLIACFSLATALLVAPSAHAQFSQYFLPTETGILNSGVDVQFWYSSLDYGGGNDVDRLFIGVEGRLKLGSLQFNVNVPFVKGWGFGDSLGDINDFQLGDIRIGAKWRLLGLSSNFGIATFLNVYLPTHSGDMTHEFAILHLGAVASAKLLGFELGGGLQGTGIMVGDNFPDQWAVGLYGYARVPLFGLIAIQACLEYWNSVHGWPGGDADGNIFYITPGIEVGIMGFRAGLATRIAVADDAKLFTGGRASLMANVGYSF